MTVLTLSSYFITSLIIILLKKENQDLREEKRAPEESLKNEITKRQKLEEKLDDTEGSYKVSQKEIPKTSLQNCRDE